MLDDQAIPRPPLSRRRRIGALCNCKCNCPARPVRPRGANEWTINIPGGDFAGSSLLCSAKIQPFQSARIDAVAVSRAASLKTDATTQTV